jgi:hypothetical protein
VNINDHASVRDLSSTVFLLMFVNSSSGVTIAKPVHKMCITVILHGKPAWWQLTSYSTLLTALHCVPSYILLTL